MKRALVVCVIFHLLVIFLRSMSFGSPKILSEWIANKHSNHGNGNGEIVNYINSVAGTKGGGCQCNNITYNCLCRIKVDTPEGNYLQYKVSPDVAFAVTEELHSKEHHVKSVWPPATPYTFEDERLTPLTGNEEPLNHMQLMPFKEKDINTTFRLFYHGLKSYQGLAVNLGDRSSLHLRRMSCDRLFAVVHGYRDSPDSSQMMLIRDNILSYYEQELDTACVITVDWRKGASVNPYTVAAGTVYGQAAANSVVVGKLTGLLILDLVQLGRINPQSVHLVGFSLGAHAMHFAGRTYSELMSSPAIGNPRGVRKVGRITGLDPAARHFQGFKDAFLEKQDADFVDIIHTSIAYHEGNYLDALNARYGNPEATGHVDFYPNGGDAPQPECKEAHSSSASRTFRTSSVNPNRASSSARESSSFSCSHNRAIYFFSDSYDRRLRQELFLSVPCDSMANYSRCREKTFSGMKNPEVSEHQAVSVMGASAVFFPGRGRQFLTYTHND